MNVGDEWETRKGLTFEDFTIVDEGVAVIWTLTDDDIAGFFHDNENKVSNNENIEKLHDQDTNMIAKKAREAINTLRMYLEKQVTSTLSVSCYGLQQKCDMNVPKTLHNIKLMKTVLFSCKQ